MFTLHADTRFAVWTGRFQPVHIGHMQVVEHSIHALQMPHIVFLTSYFGWKADDSDYAAHARHAYSSGRNPLTVWERSTLMRQALQGAGLEDVLVLNAPRHDLDWAKVQDFYPTNRLICLTAKDAFESAKAELWKLRGESVHVFSEVDASFTVTTTQIKEFVASGDDWRRYIPAACHQYFAEIDGPRRVFGGRPA